MKGRRLAGVGQARGPAGGRLAELLLCTCFHAVGTRVVDLSSPVLHHKFHYCSVCAESEPQQMGVCYTPPANGLGSEPQRHLG